MNPIISTTLVSTPHLVTKLLLKWQLFSTTNKNVGLFPHRLCQSSATDVLLMLYMLYIHYIYIYTQYIWLLKSIIIIIIGHQDSLILKDDFKSWWWFPKTNICETTGQYLMIWNSDFDQFSTSEFSAAQFSLSWTSLAHMYFLSGDFLSGDFLSGEVTQKTLSLFYDTCIPHGLTINTITIQWVCPITL